MKKEKYYKIEKRFPNKDEYIKCLSVNKNEYKVEILETKEEKKANKEGKYLEIAIDSNNLKTINNLISKKGYLLYPVFIHCLQECGETVCRYSFKGGIIGYSLVLLKNIEDFMVKIKNIELKYCNEDIDKEELTKRLDCIYYINDFFDKLYEERIELSDDNKKSIILNNNEQPTHKK